MLLTRWVLNCTMIKFSRLPDSSQIASNSRIFCNTHGSINKFLAKKKILINNTVSLFPFLTTGAAEWIIMNVLIGPFQTQSLS